MTFTPHIERYIACPPRTVEAGTVREALEAAFAGTPAARGYILDDQGRLRKHIVVFVNGEIVRDREGLADPLEETDEVFVMPALSGGCPEHMEERS